MDHESEVISNVTKYSGFSKRLIQLAPLSDTNSLKLDISDKEFGQKKYVYRSSPYNGSQATSIARRNARERNRVKQVNDSFNALRRRLPAAVIAALSSGPRRGTGKKLSKVDTLRMVVEYIRHLEDILKENEDGNQEEVSDEINNHYMSYTQGGFDERLVCDSSSPYSDSVPSPDSDCSSRVDGYSKRFQYFDGNYDISVDNLNVMDEQMFDQISWYAK